MRIRVTCSYPQMIKSPCDTSREAGSVKADLPLLVQGQVKLMRFMVCYDTHSTIEALQRIGQVVFRSSLVNWLALEADESDEQRIAQVPGVLEVYQEAEGVWLGDVWMPEAIRQTKLNAMHKLLSQAEADLARLREQTADNPEVLAFFEPSALELISRVKGQIELLDVLDY